MTRAHGFTLVEIMVALGVSAIVLLGIANLFASNRRVSVEENLDARLEGSLRLAVTQVSRDLRSSGYGVPTSNLSTWVPWVAGFTVNPKITQGAGANPDTISVARCTLSTLTTLAANAAKGATTISVAATTGIDTANKRLLVLDDDEPLQVASIAGTTLTIDTNVTTAGQQGLKRAYPAGAPVCRVDVMTYSVDTATSTLREDFNDGAGAQVVSDQIIDMQIAAAGLGFTLSMTARSTELNPRTHAAVTRTRNVTVAPRN